MTEYLNFHTIAAALNAIVLGGGLILTFVVAPTVFRLLDRAQAGRLMGAVFNRSLPLFAAASFIAAMLLFYRIDAVLLGANAVGYLVSWQLLMPAIERLRDAREQSDTEARRRFRVAHGASQALNLLQLALAALVFFRLAI